MRRKSLRVSYVQFRDCIRILLTVFHSEVSIIPNIPSHWIKEIIVSKKVPYTNRCAIELSHNFLYLAIFYNELLLFQMKLKLFGYSFWQLKSNIVSFQQIDHVMYFSLEREPPVCVVAYPANACPRQILKVVIK